MALPPSALRNVPAALALTSHDFGLIHWNAAAPPYPTGLPPVSDSSRRELAIFHESHSSTAAPPQWSALSTPALLSTRLPSPSGTRNIMAPIPVTTPRRHGSPRSTPAFAPAAVSMILLGPGVIAATTAKRRNATARSVVVLYLQGYALPEHQIGRRRS